MRAEQAESERRGGRDGMKEGGNTRGGRNEGQGEEREGEGGRKEKEIGVNTHIHVQLWL